MFLCEDQDCWITPADVVARRRERDPELAVAPVVLYTPLDFRADEECWVAEAIAPGTARSIGSVAVRAPGWHLGLEAAALTIVVGPYGAPAAINTLEMAIGLGARTILFFGICGSLQPDLRIGDLVVVEEAIREEGTSYHYIAPDAPARASPRLVELADRMLGERGLPHRRGKIWTTDAPYRETKTKVARLASEGVLGVEMEVSALYALAQYRGVDALAIQIVSDELHGSKWTGINREQFVERCHEAVRLLAELGVRSARAPAS